MQNSVAFCAVLLCWLCCSSGGIAIAAERPSYVLNQRAVEKMQQGEYPAALELLKQALEIQPRSEVLLYNLGQAHLLLGKQLIQQKDFQQAAEVLDRGKQYDGQESRLWLNRGVALLGNNDYLYAEAELNEAWAMNGDEPQVLWLLGRLYDRTDRVREAIEVWERALQLDSQNQLIAGHLEKARQELAVESQMEKGYGGHFVLSYDGQVSTELSNDILEVLEDAYNWVGYQLDHYPQRQVPVLIYADKDFDGLTGSPDWVSGLYDGKIRLPAGGLTSVDTRVKGLLFHEYMHVVAHELAGTHLPFWLSEGLAEVAAAQHRTPSIEILAEFSVRGELFAWAELEDLNRKFSGSRVKIAYLQSYSFVRYLLDEFGWFQLRDLLTTLGTGVALGPAIDQTVGVYAVDYESLAQNWKDQLPQ
ncbi:MAG: hypothetical protein C0618_01405 [Desulfuromonas sp.]|nr:MAG: hypothetical protein C0618_01405 [Desulfuromonas sp.]